MAARAELPIYQITQIYRDYLEQWEVPRSSTIFSFPPDSDREVHAWFGGFALGETVAIVAPDHGARDILGGDLYTGILREAELIAAEGDQLRQGEIILDSATHHALGLNEAVRLLTIIKGSRPQ